MALKFASVYKCEGIRQIFGSVTKGALALHKLYTRERHFCFGIENWQGNIVQFVFLFIRRDAVIPPYIIHFLK